MAGQANLGSTTVITVNWNGMDVIPGLMDSLLPQLRENGLKLTVVDNGSTDGSDDLIENEYIPSGLVELVRMDTNLGYGQAANHVILSCTDEFAILLNSDLMLKPDSLELLLRSLIERPDAAMAGPRLLWPDDSLQPSQRDFIFPGYLLREHMPFLRKRTARFSAHDSGRYVDWLVGAALAIRVKPFQEAGGYSKEYAFFHEETDLMYRLHKAGWKIWFEPSSEMYHLESITSRKCYGDRIDVRSMPAKLIFLRRHGGQLSTVSYRLLKSVLVLCRFTGRLLSRNDADDSGSFAYLKDALRTLWSSPERPVDQT